jgi:hypothetical protein
MSTATVSPVISDREWNAHILAQVAAGKLSQEAALPQLKTAPPRSSGGSLSCKVSEKGGLSVYGLNAKWPVTLYADQWDRLLGFADEIRRFKKAHNAELSHSKAESKAMGDAHADKARKSFES